MFKLNSDGEINYISTAKASKEACADGDTLYTQLEAGSYKWYYIMKNFEGKYPLSKNTYYMRVPASGSDFRDETLFGCQPFGNVTWFNTDTTKNILGLYKFGYVNTLYAAPYSSGLNSVLQIGAVPGETQDTYQTDTMSNSNIRFVVVDSSRRNNKVYMGNFDQMTSYEDSGIIDETSKAFVHTRSGWIIAVIIYK